mmetsp:Transcript_36466/g.85234  ORF Transcript_36466/g.85234 Transcript_36466/m.85234 type:complete len:207 (-) Transcript_36466:396-1016(-)
MKKISMPKCKRIRPQFSRKTCKSVRSKGNKQLACSSFAAFENVSVKETNTKMHFTIPGKYVDSQETSKFNLKNKASSTKRLRVSLKNSERKLTTLTTDEVQRNILLPHHSDLSCPMDERISLKSENILQRSKKHQCLSSLLSHTSNLSKYSREDRNRAFKDNKNRSSESWEFHVMVDGTVGYTRTMSKYERYNRLSSTPYSVAFLL